jgi:hypothetical protein
MPKQAQAKPESSWISLRDTFDWTHFILRMHAILLLPFLRSGWGASQLGVVGLLALCVVLPFYISLAESEFMLRYFWQAWLAAVLYRWLESAVLRWRGRLIHSQYEGYPWLASRVFFWVRDEQKLFALEPILCLAIGASLMPVEEAFARFVMYGCGSLLALDCLHRALMRKRRYALIDQRLEMERETQMHRSMR